MPVNSRSKMSASMREGVLKPLKTGVEGNFAGVLGVVRVVEGWYGREIWGAREWMCAIVRSRLLL